MAAEALLMRHTETSANQMIKISALVIGGVYLYRRFTEGTAEELKASKKLTPLPRFIVGWGVVFVGLSVIAPATPTLAGNMALMVMIASLLANGTEISKDLQAGLKEGAPKAKKGAARGQGARGRHSPSTVTPPASEPAPAPEPERTTIA
jgi:hypothetical protein